MRIGLGRTFSSFSALEALYLAEWIDSHDWAKSHDYVGNWLTVVDQNDRHYQFLTMGDLYHWAGY